MAELSKYNELGQEIPDAKPVALPVGFERPLPLGERIRRLVQNEVLRRELDAAGVETFEDADDFEVDDMDRATPYEDIFDPAMPGITAREQELRAGFVEQMPSERVADLISKHRRKPTADVSDGKSPAEGVVTKP